MANRNVCIVISSKFITNWRWNKFYKPAIIKEMRAHKGWTDKDEDKEAILEMLKGLIDRPKNAAINS